MEWKQVRNKGIATRMLDVLLSKRAPDQKRADTAFSDTTAAGHRFAESYTGTDRYLCYKPDTDWTDEALPRSNSGGGGGSGTDW